MLSILPPENPGDMRRKRKLSPEAFSLPVTKRHAEAISKISRHVHPLAIITRQYQLLESLVSNLRSYDLLSLALTSKALYRNIFTTTSSLENLLGRLKCSGGGIRIRNQRHKKSSFFYSYNCTEYVRCGSDSMYRDIETRPCITCKVATCNECRIHCVYQSIYEASSDPDDEAELPNFSGFVLLKPLEQPILSPHHLISEASKTASRWRNPSGGLIGPYHDQGYLDVPLETGASAPPECIENILDLDLGSQSLVSMSGGSRYAAPSPVRLSLCQVTEARKVKVCASCVERDAIRRPRTIQPKVAAKSAASKASDKSVSRMTTRCHCTLRKRMIDRWLCLRCYSAEESAIEERARHVNSGSDGICSCGNRARHIICLWCHGTTSEGRTL